ncbi:MAG: hypothetical protein LBF58_09710 [Deltaproteobacteria bacterium]|nr:hypothetical protein [Deltaproteobacteria bacterium]
MNDAGAAIYSLYVTDVLYMNIIALATRHVKRFFDYRQKIFKRPQKAPQVKDKREMATG